MEEYWKNDDKMIPPEEEWRREEPYWSKFMAG
jgi:hypothetical protein